MRVALPGEPGQGSLPACVREAGAARGPPARFPAFSILHSGGAQAGLPSSEGPLSGVRVRSPPGTVRGSLVTSAWLSLLAALSLSP